MAQLTIQQAFDLALRHHQAGRLQDAEPIYREILARQPGHADALHLLGVIAYQVGRLDTAVELMRQAIALKPRLPEAYNNLGAALKDTGQLDEAIAACRQAIALRPNYADAHSNLGNALKDKGQLNEAIAAYRRAIALQPNYPEAHNNLGNALRDKGQLDGAIAAHRRAIGLRANYPDAHYNLGNALTDKGQLDEAIAAYRQAIALKPNDPRAHNNLGNALREKGQLDEAIAAYRQALALKPNYPEAHNNLGIALKDTGRLDEAIAAFRQAITLKPNFAEAYNNLVYTMHFHPAYDAQSVAEEHRRWNLQHAAPLKKHWQPHANDRSPERRLRIGYVSPDFRNHVVGRFLLPLWEQHDHRNFEIFGYAQVPAPDAITQRLRACTDSWRNIVGRSDGEVAELIRQDRIDLLVDLSLHMAGNRLLVFAPSRRRCKSLGWGIRGRRAWRRWITVSRTRTLIPRASTTRAIRNSVCGCRKRVAAISRRDRRPRSMRCPPWRRGMSRWDASTTSARSRRPSWRRGSGYSMPCRARICCCMLMRARIGSALSNSWSVQASIQGVSALWATAARSILSSTTASTSCWIRFPTAGARPRARRSGWACRSLRWRGKRRVRGWGWMP